MEKLLEKLKLMHEERKKLMDEVDSADEARFSEIRSRIDKLDYMIADIEKEIAAKKGNQEYDKVQARAEATTEDENLELRGPVEKKPAQTQKISEQELREASFSSLGKMIRASVNNNPAKFTEAEKRALGDATFTTSETYIQPTASTEGVNNGGVFIPSRILYDLLKVDEVENQFLKDCLPTFEKGVVVYPYVETETYTKSKAVKEKQEGGSKSIKFANLDLTEGNYAVYAGITLELLAKADSELGQYFLEQLAIEADLILSEDIFYGVGGKEDKSDENNHILGVAKSSDTTKKEYADGKEIEAITDSYLMLSRRARRGAKLYISRKLSMKLTLKKDDGGHYLLPIYNGVGINSIVEIPVVTVEDLKDYDFVLGNARNYKINFYGDKYTIYNLGVNKKRVLEFMLHMLVCGAPAPGYFVYGTLKATQSNSGSTPQNPSQGS